MNILYKTAIMIKWTMPNLLLGTNDKTIGDK